MYLFNPTNHVLNHAQIKILTLKIPTFRIPTFKTLSVIIPSFQVQDLNGLNQDENRKVKSIIEIMSREETLAIFNDKDRDAFLEAEAEVLTETKVLTIVPKASIYQPNNL